MEHWQMESLYGNVDSPRFQEDLKREVELARNLQADLENPGQDFVEALDRYQKILDIDETLEAFASCMQSTDTRSALFAKGVSQAEEASLAVADLEVHMLLFVQKRKDEVAGLTRKGGKLEAYAFVLGQMLEQAGHTMSPELENLASDLGRSGTEAFRRLQDTVSSQAEIGWGDGKRTGTQLRGYAFSPDRELRRIAFERETALWKEHAPAFVAALNGVKGTTITLDGRRGWKSPLERSVSQSRLDPPTFHALIDTLKESLPVFRRYLAVKAKALGLEKLAFYDLFAPVGEGSTRYAYGEAQEFVVRQVSAFSPRMGSFMRDAFRKGWVDPMPHAGKVGGAFDTAFPLFGESRVLANFDGTYNGVSTFAHELGHAFHDSIVLPLPSLLRTYPMTLAETASIFSEFVTLKGALEESTSRGERVMLEDQFLQNACQVCVDILSRFLFEDEVFRLRKEGEVPVDTLCKVMVKAQQDTYGPLSAYHPYMWTMKSHYYSSDFSYYNYPYAFGQLFGLGLYRVYEADPARFEEKYVTLLSATGSQDAATCAASIGLDIRDKRFWEESVSVIQGFVEAFAHDCAN